MIKYHCDNCGCDMSKENKRYVLVKDDVTSVGERYDLELCNLCWLKLKTHIRKAYYRYEKGLQGGAARSK